MADAMRVLRPLILRQTELPESRRREIFRDLATPDALDVLAFGGVDALRAWLAAQHPELSTP